MMRRILSSLAVLALALSVSPTTFAGEEAPAVPVQQEDFLATLQAPAAPETPEQPSLEAVRTNPALVFKHGTNCYYVGSRDCISCAIGKRKSCDDYRCFYNGTWHTDSYCSPCATYC